MAISPASDIVLDVVRAANPASRNAAAARLHRMAGAAPTQGFARVSEDIARHAPPSLPFDAARGLVHLRNSHALRAERAEPYERFEAFVLQTFVESMLPSGNSALFGTGTAGDVWRSWLARGLAGELAQSGGIGIGGMLARAAEDAGDRRMAGVAPAPLESVGA